MYCVNKISFILNYSIDSHRNDLGLKIKICYKNHEYLIDSLLRFYIVNVYQSIYKGFLKTLV
jgi:hypothetical protein